MYQMTTLSNGARIRNQPNTAGDVLASVSAGVIVKGTDLFTASHDLYNSSGIYQKTGDQWLKVSYNGVAGWMAYIHMGGYICKDFKEIIEAPTEPVTTFPQSFTLTDDKGKSAVYLFLKEL